MSEAPFDIPPAVFASPSVGAATSLPDLILYEETHLGDGYAGKEFGQVSSFTAVEVIPIVRAASLVSKSTVRSAEHLTLSEFATSLEWNVAPEDGLLELADGFFRFAFASVHLYHNSKDVHLHMSVAISQLAVNSAPRHFALLLSRLYAHAESLLLRFRRLYKPPNLGPDLEAAISSLRRAVDLAPVDGPEKPRYLSLLGLALWFGSRKQADPPQSLGHHQIPHPIPTWHVYNGNLDLVQLMSIPSNAKELAMLSECQTATGDERLLEEAVHLAGGMLAAGFRSVVATVWSIADEDCPDFADALYGALKKRFISRPHEVGLEVTYAVHKATESLRKKVGEGEFAR